MAGNRHVVYVLKSLRESTHYYVGVTGDATARLNDHNAGRCQHTAKFRPWQLHVTIAFGDETRALRFERYLKSGSGRAFAVRHFEP